MSKNELIIGQIYTEKFTRKRFDGKGVLEYELHVRYNGAPHFNFDQLDGTKAHFSEAVIARLSVSDHTPEHWANVKKNCAEK